MGCTLSSRTSRRGYRCWNATRTRCCTRRWQREREPFNLDLLHAAVALVEDLGRAPATTAQARKILGVPFSRRRA